MTTRTTRRRARYARLGLPAVALGALATTLVAPAANAADRTEARSSAFGRVSAESPKRLLAAPTAVTAAAATVSAAVAQDYTIQAGDTVSAIAGRFGLGTNDVLSWNGLSWRTVIYPGQTLRLAAPAAVVAATPAAATAAPSPAVDPSAAVHTVVPGDTLYGIAGKYGTSVSALLNANGLQLSSIIYPGQRINLGSTATATAAEPAAAAPAPAAEPAAAPAATTTSDAGVHTVTSGDTLYGIAGKYGTSVSALLNANGLQLSSIIYPGQRINLGSTATAAEPAAAAPAPAAEPAAAPAATTTSDAGVHTVTSGDTLYGIAGKYGTTLAALLEANGLQSSSIIYPGQTLRLAGASVSPAATTVTPASTEPAASTPAQKSATLSGSQVENAQLIIRIGRELGVPDRGIAIALASAMVESWIQNLDYGDRDSLGLFQQRPSAGWGTPEQILDRERSIRVFYGGPQDPNGTATRGLLDIPGWEGKTFTEAAQAVQISAFPDRYGQWEEQAYAWLALYG